MIVSAAGAGVCIDRLKEQNVTGLVSRTAAATGAGSR